MGGGSVLFGVLSLQKNNQLNIKKIVASDANSALIAVYNNIKNNYKLVLDNISILIENYKSIDNQISDNLIRTPNSMEEALSSRESFYYWCRMEYCNMNQEEQHSPMGSALFIFLNKTCFRGLYRVGPKGFNVPFGHYEKIPEIINPEHIQNISELIQNVEFKVLSFEDAIKDIKSTDFTYLDPPYLPETEKSFVSYVKDGFGEDNHNLLFELCKRMQSSGIKFLMSNSYVPLIDHHLIMNCLL